MSVRLYIDYAMVSFFYHGVFTALGMNYRGSETAGLLLEGFKQRFGKDGTISANKWLNAWQTSAVSPLLQFL